MGGMSNQSPAVLKKSTGAANVGRGGSTVAADLTTIEAAVAAAAEVAAAAMPKAGGTFTEDVIFDERVFLRNNKSLYGESDIGAGYELISVNTANQINVNSGRIPGHVIFDLDINYIGFLAAGGSGIISWTVAGVQLQSGPRVNAIHDQDDMSSNSATALVTQQSVKAYVDNSIDALVLGSLVFLGEYIHSGASVAEVNFDDLDRGLYDTFVIDVQNAEPSSTGQTLQARVRKAGVTQSGSDYFRSGGGTTSYTSVTVSATVNNASGNGAGVCARITLSFYSHEEHALGIHACGITQQDVTGNVVLNDMGGVFKAGGDTSTVDGVSLSMSGSNILSGHYRIYGVKKA